MEKSKLNNLEQFARQMKEKIGQIYTFHEFDAADPDYRQEYFNTQVTRDSIKHSSMESVISIPYTAIEIMPSKQNTDDWWLLLPFWKPSTIPTPEGCHRASRDFYQDLTGNTSGRFLKETNVLPE